MGMDPRSALIFGPMRRAPQEAYALSIFIVRSVRAEDLLPAMQPGLGNESVPDVEGGEHECHDSHRVPLECRII